MKESFRVIYYVPWGIFILLNSLLLFIIFLLRNIGQATVWCNNHIAKTGDYFGDLARNDDKLDELVDRIKKSKRRKLK